MESNFSPLMPSPNPSSQSQPERTAGTKAKVANTDSSKAERTDAASEFDAVYESLPEAKTSASTADNPHNPHSRQIVDDAELPLAASIDLTNIKFSNDSAQSALALSDNIAHRTSGHAETSETLILAAKQPKTASTPLAQTKLAGRITVGDSPLTSNDTVKMPPVSSLEKLTIKSLLDPSSTVKVPTTPIPTLSTGDALASGPALLATQSATAVGGGLYTVMHSTPVAPGHLGQVAHTPVLQQIATAVVAAPSERTIEVRLDPPSLGKVHIDFDVPPDGPVRAVISAENSDTLALLRRQSALLAKELADAGFADASVDFQEHNSDQNQPQEGKEIFIPLDSVELSQLPPAATQINQRTPQGGLNIRL